MDGFRGPCERDGALDLSIRVPIAHELHHLHAHQRLGALVADRVPVEDELQQAAVLLQRRHDDLSPRRLHRRRAMAIAAAGRVQTCAPEGHSRLKPRSSLSKRLLVMSAWLMSTMPALPRLL